VRKEYGRKSLLEVLKDCLTWAEWVEESLLEQGRFGARRCDDLHGSISIADC